MTVNYNKVLPELYVGTVATSIQDIDKLKQQCGITAVVNLQTEADFVYYRIDWPTIEGYYQACKIEVYRVPIRDFDLKELVQHLPAAIATIDSLIRAGHRVYLHCTAGINRSPTVAIAYLHRYKGYDLKTAIRIVRDCRNCDPMLDALYDCKFD